MEIRPASPRELDSVWQQIVAEDLNPQRDGSWLGLFDDRLMVGAVHIVAVAGVPLLDDLWVTPRRRRQGLGATLVRYVQERSARLWLIADPDGIAYYERLGFHPRSPLPEPVASRYAALGLWPGHLGHLHAAMYWQRRVGGGSKS